MKKTPLLIAFILLIFSSCEMGKSIGACPTFEGAQTSVSKGGKQAPKVKKKKDRANKKLEKKKVQLQEKLDLLVGNIDVQTIVNHMFDENQANQWSLPDSTCPMIVLKDQSMIYAEVKKMENDTLYLESCDSSKNTFSIPNSTIRSIEYNPEEYNNNRDKEIDLENYEADGRYSEYAGYSDYEYQELKRAKNGAIWSLVLGIASIFGALFLFGMLLAIPAVIIGSKSLNTYNAYPEYREGRGMASAGKVIGIIMLGIALLFLILILLIISAL